MNKKELKRKAQNLAMKAVAREIWKRERDGEDRELLLEMDKQLKRIEKSLGWYEHADTILDQQNL